MMKEKFIEAGEVVNTHGVRGEIKILPWTDSAEFLKSFKTLYINGTAYRVRSSFVHKACLVAALEDITDVNVAMTLKGKTVCIDRDDAKLPKGHFFLSDIMGATVVTEDGVNVGTLTDIIENPTQNVYVVCGDREHLIPAVPEFILKTDVDAAVITVRLIEGM